MRVRFDALFVCLRNTKHMYEVSIIICMVDMCRYSTIIIRTNEGKYILTCFSCPNLSHYAKNSHSAFISDVTCLIACSMTKVYHIVHGIYGIPMEHMSPFFSYGF